MLRMPLVFCWLLNSVNCFYRLSWPFRGLFDPLKQAEKVEMDEYNVISLICKLKPPLGRWPSIINLMESGRCWAHGQEFPM